MRMEKVAASNGFRPLSAIELGAVSGGLQEIPPETSPPIVVTGTRPPDGWASIPGEDLWMYPELFNDGPGSGFGDYGDGGGDPNDVIVVTAEPMTDEEKAAYDHWEEQATLLVDGLIYGSIAATGFAGLAGKLGAAAAVGTLALAMERQNLINDLTKAWYGADAADGNADGVRETSSDPNGTYWGPG